MQANAKTQGTGSRLGNRVKIARWIGHPVYRWRVSYIDTGAHKRKGFRTQREAEEWAESRESENLEHGTSVALTAKERSTVADTRERLESLGVDLRTAVDFAIQAYQRLKPLAVTPAIALDHAVEYFTRASRSITVAEMISDLIQSKRRSGHSERYLYDLKSRLGKFEDSFRERAIATIERREIADWLHELKVGPITTNNYRRLLVVMFNEARKAGFLAENPAAETEKSKVIEGEVGILSPEEIARILDKAGDEIRAVFAIGAFAGVRSAELESLDWSEIDLNRKHIRIRPKIAKSASNRLIPISDNLKAWLQPLAQPSGPIFPTNGRKLMDATKRAAGFGTPGTETPEEQEKGIELKPWPSNALRHSFASYHLAKHQSADELALAMGHQDTKLIFKHYREVVIPEQAETYWSILPGKPENVIQMGRAG